MFLAFGNAIDASLCDAEYDTLVRVQCDKTWLHPINLIYSQTCPLPAH